MADQVVEKPQPEHSLIKPSVDDFFRDEDTFHIDVPVAPLEKPDLQAEDIVTRPDVEDVQNPRPESENQQAVSPAPESVKEPRPEGEKIRPDLQDIQKPPEEPKVDVKKPKEEVSKQDEKESKPDVEKLKVDLKAAKAHAEDLKPDIKDPKPNVGDHPKEDVEHPKPVLPPTEPAKGESPLKDEALHPVPPTNPPLPHEDRRLVVLAPANTPNPNLCKFMVSAIALGYPSPIIVNWGRDPYEMSKWKGGPNLSKISGIMRYLDAVLHEDAHPDDKLHKDDIVVIADGFDVWFQLPPDVLLKRYHESNARANARLRELWTHKEPMSMQQTIIVSSQKRCWPSVEEGSNLHCNELPESPLRKDLYGPDTDKMIDPASFHNMRPRYINGGVYIGAAGDLRRMFRRAFDKVDSDTSKGIHLFSEQGISGEVLGEQETWRNWRRKHELVGNDAMGLMERDFEYHIGLDYSQELSIATCHAEPDGQVVPLNNQSAVDEYSAELGIFPVRVQGVPEDIRTASNPLNGLVEAPNWGDMPLYADFFTESVPTLLHHNAWKDNMKERRVWWWDRMWFFGHLRDLLVVRLKPAPLVPLAKVKTKTRDITYWAPHSDTLRRKPRLLVDKAFEPLGEIEFDAVCRFPDENVYSKQHWWDEVFRDGKGPI